MLANLLALFLTLFSMGAAIAMFFMNRAWGGAYLSPEAQ